MRLEVLGVERRRRWSDDEKLAVVSEVGVNGATVAEVAQRHDVTRKHIYQWRRELRSKGLWNDGEDLRFLRLPVSDAPRPVTGSAAVEILFSNGRALRGVEGLAADDLARLIRVVEST